MSTAVLNAWDPATMSTGIPSIDRQHKELFSRVGELKDAMRAGRGRDEIGTLLDFLGEYVKAHFADEERLMEQHKCPAARANREAHAKLLAEWKSTRARFDREGASAAMVLEIHKTLSGWLFEHIHRIDTRLRDCVSGGN